MPRAANTPSLFEDEPRLPEGFVYRPGFLSVEEEADILARVSRLEFGEVRMHGVVARRRIVQFGWRYRFDSRALTDGPPVPAWLEPLQSRAAGLAHCSAAALSEVLVTEYAVGATIGWHRDAPPFGLVVGLSLKSGCRMRFRAGATGAARAELWLEPGSAYLLDGPARSQWQHNIPAVPELRYSITFRTLRRPDR